MKRILNMNNYVKPLIVEEIIKLEDIVLASKVNETSYSAKNSNIFYDDFD